MNHLLEIRELSVRAGGRILLHNINLNIDEGTVNVLMGPNAAGKSTLLKTIMGDPRYEVVRGSIIFNGMKINDLKPYERAKLGIAMAFQNPPRIRVKFGYLIRRLSKEPDSNINSLINEANLRYLLGRDLFHGFSGGEIKKAELLLTLLQKPKLALLDEPDSGVDVDSMNIVASMINNLVDSGASVLLVTHTGLILRYLKHLDIVHVLIDGRIVYSGNPFIIENILKYGYDHLEKCGVIRHGKRY